jgi:hypothetical protein
MVRVGRQDCRENLIVVGQGVIETFDDYATNSVGTTVAISGLIPDFALARKRQEMTLSELTEIVWVGDNIQASRNGSVHISSPQS